MKSLSLSTAVILLVLFIASGNEITAEANAIVSSSLISPVMCTAELYEGEGFMEAECNDRCLKKYGHGQWSHGVCLKKRGQPTICLCRYPC